ncbi:SGNH/GDSL hydrolase family protein [Sphingomonas gei]|uniref:SGNH/GDSL hydrolase family protein n=1 Tax=Sphingomonas gei TaxID=1395960 RepID=UPI0014422957|nr:SGNH/GDSL hydrolase family protein [Sphingomonas gei]
MNLLLAAALLSSSPQVVPAWTASQQPVWGADFLFPTNIPQLGGRTLRQIVRLGIGGTNVRIVFANTYGAQPVTLVGVHAAPSRGGSRIDSTADRIVHFGGEDGVTIAPGATVTSDPLPITVAAGHDLAISIRFAAAPEIGSFHWDGRRTGYVIAGDRIATSDPAVETTTTARLLLAGVLVDAPAARGTIVVLGDSITDGAGATLDAEARWPDYLAARAAPQGIAVVNAGISGARLLRDGMGVGALARFDRDVLTQPGIATLVLALGINDIAWPGTPFDPGAAAMEFDTLASGYRALVARAHGAGIRVVGTTLAPFADALPGSPLHATYHSPAKEALRRRINAWIRDSGAFDAVVDFDRVLQDPARPHHLAPAYDSGDHLHPGDAGNRAMADAVPLSILIEGPTS